MDFVQSPRQVVIQAEFGVRVWCRALEAGRATATDGECRLRLVCAEPDWDSVACLGMPVSVQIRSDGQVLQECNGLVSAATCLGRVGRYTEHVLVLRPWLWWLGHTRHSRIFQEQTVPEILKQVLAPYPQADYRLDLQGQFLPLPYCVQYQETDLAFVHRLLARAGLWAFFEYRHGLHCWVVADGPHADVVLSPEPGVHWCNPPDLQQIGGVPLGLWSWQTVATVQPQVCVMRDVDFTQPLADLEVRQARPDHGAAVLAQTLEDYQHPGGYTDQATAQRKATWQTQIWEQQAHFAIGTGHVWGLWPGVRFRLLGHPLASCCQEYVVLETDYALEQPDAGGEDWQIWWSVRVRVQLAAQARAPLPLPSWPKVAGPHTATVTGPADSEIHTDAHGRIQVRFYWDRATPSQEATSCWIRVLQPWAGARWGIQTLPRVGQEVLVAYLDGDPERPVVLGSLYNAHHMPPYRLPENRTQSGIRSRSSPGAEPTDYNEIAFEDRAGAEVLAWRAQRDGLFTVKNDQRAWVGHDQHLVVQNNRFEQIGQDAHLRIDGDQRLEVQGAWSCVVHEDWQARLQGRCLWQVSDQIHWQTAARMVLEAGQQITLKVGNQGLQIDATGVSVLGAPLVCKPGAVPLSGQPATPAFPEMPQGVPPATTALSPVPTAGTPSAASRQILTWRQAQATGVPLVRPCEG